MYLQYCIIVVILCASFGMNKAAKEEYGITEVCEGIQKFYNLLQPLYYGLKIDFKNQDRNLRGKGRITPTKNLTISDCKAEWTNSDRSSMAVSATMRDNTLTVMLEHSPWIVITDPVVEIGMTNEVFGRHRQITMSSLNLNFLNAQVNRTSLDDTSTKSIKDLLSEKLTDYAKRQSFRVDNEFQVDKRTVKGAIQEMFMYYIYRLKKLMYF